MILEEALLSLQNFAPLFVVVLLPIELVGGGEGGAEEEEEEEPGFNFRDFFFKFSLFSEEESPTENLASGFSPSCSCS